jgi:hypothetical protein
MSLEIHIIADKDISAIVKEPLKFEILNYGEILEPSTLDDYTIERRDALLSWQPQIESEMFNLRGTFQSLHYLLTGETEWSSGVFPLNFITGKRLKIGEIGWGEVQAYTSSEVKEIAKALKGLDLANIQNRYSVVFFNGAEIYPASRGYKWTENDRAELMENIRQLITFVNSVANRNLGFYMVLI